MQKLVSEMEYLEQTAQTRDQRMKWWREARFGMFVHYGLYSTLERMEWAMARENISVSEYEKLADQFAPKVGAPREWVQLAKSSGMKYVVLTTRHHEGFSLWDSKVNPYNSVNYGPHRDMVREFVDACREFDLKIGFYSSLMDWHHPDGGRCAYDSEARKRFNDYIYELNRELLTNYGKIDILWYDVPQPLQHAEGWNSLEMNQRLRMLQPELIINNRSRLDEDFGTPEEHLTATDGDWEACMTFNGISWGYVDSEQAKAYSYNAPRILRMLHTVTTGGGNLLLNVGPRPDGSIPEEVIEPLATVGKWLSENGEAVYGKADRGFYPANGLGNCSRKGKDVYLWNWIWPANHEMCLGGFFTTLKRASLLADNRELDFVQEGHRIILRGLPEHSPDRHANIGVIKLEFDKIPTYEKNSDIPPLHGGRDFRGLALD